jgi:hypothetical protein
MARRSAATASFSARRCVRVRTSTGLGKCKIFGRRAPTFRSFGFAYGFIGVITKHNTSINRAILYLASSYRNFIRTAGISDPGYNGSAEGKDACGYEHLDRLILL